MNATALRMRSVQLLLILGLAFGLGACAGDRVHSVRVSVPQQRMAVYRQGVEIARYRVSTSKYGLGSEPGSYRTPLGKLEIAQKIGGGSPAGMRFKNRRATGEIVAVNAPGRDPIVTRILWLKGLESRNANTYERLIYIHGTPEERNLGTPVSYGCIRMASRDIIRFYNTVGEGTRVTVTEQELPVPGEGPK
jgi:lipoprotein-anchoring transpeptidase ErfK/SrfK